MIYQLLVLLHVLGACTWLGGHIVLVVAVLPDVRRRADITPISAFESRFGRWALAALAVQIATGAVLASRWLGGWSNILSRWTPATPYVLAKLALLVAILALAGNAYHRVVPRLSPATLPDFELHTQVVTGLSVLFAVTGVLIRTGGVFL